MLCVSGNYDARCRVFLRHLCSLLAVCFDNFEEVFFVFTLIF